MRRYFHLSGESQLWPPPLRWFFFKTLLELPENIEELWELHYGCLEALTCLISVKCSSLRAEERKRDYCCYGDGRAVQAAWLFFPLLRLIIWNGIKMGLFVVFLWMWNCESPNSESSESYEPEDVLFYSSSNFSRASFLSHVDWMIPTTAETDWSEKRLFQRKKTILTYFLNSKLWIFQIPILMFSLSVLL